MSVLLTAPVSNAVALAPPSAKGLECLQHLHELTLCFPQAEIATEHLFHGGMYARTIRLEPGTILNGSLIRRATVLIIHGRCTVTNGDERVEVDGYRIFSGLVGRKQSFRTWGPVEMTMVFPTETLTVAEAEDEVFAEADQLMSRKDSSRDQIAITGQ